MAIVLAPEDIEAITRLLDDRLGLDALWVFGSVAAGAVTEASDVDLAALFRRKPSAVELVELREDIGRLLRREIDLVDLGQASPVVAMQVLRHGRLLVDGDPHRRRRFVAGVPGRYEDLKIVRREAERALLDRVRRGGS